MTEPPVGGQRLHRFRSRLLAERERLQQLVSRLEDLGLEASQAESLGELSTYDNHPADIGDELFERSKDRSIKNFLERQIHAIEAALVRIDNGQYGLCSDCGRPIPLERLEALPSAAFCIDCQIAHEGSAGQSGEPAQEWFPPLGHDAAAIWQEVERYGTSSTPPDETDPPMLQ